MIRREGQHDEGRPAVPSGGSKLLERRGQTAGHGRDRGDGAGALHSARHVQLLGQAG